MLARKKLDSGRIEAPTAAVAKAVGGGGEAARHSPARALQQRLAREVFQPARPWLWHSAGLVLITVLSVTVAGLMLGPEV